VKNRYCFYYKVSISGIQDLTGRLKLLTGEKSNLELTLDKMKIELVESKRHSASLEQVGIKIVLEFVRDL
jgi:hypothetical protein